MSCDDAIETITVITDQWTGCAVHRGNSSRLKALSKVRWDVSAFYMAHSPRSIFQH